MNFLAFDIETAKPAPRGDDADYNLGITCAAIVKGGLDIPQHIHTKDGPKYADVMSIEDVRAFADILLDAHHNQGYSICSINGVSFDFRVLANECQDLIYYDNLRELALNSFDPCFQLLCSRGYPVGLQAMSDGFELEGKMKGMDGLQSVDAWKKDLASQQKVLEYVAQDARVTKQICECIEEEGVFRWIAKSGRRMSDSAYGFMTAKEAHEHIPQQNVDWMDNPPNRMDFIGWCLEEEEW